MANTKEMVLKADDITCPGCACDIEALLREREGITDASVNYASEIISVRYDPLVIDRKAVFFAVRRLGYEVRILEEK